MPTFQRAIVLGSTGMLGGRVLREFKFHGTPVVGLSRSTGFDVVDSDQTKNLLVELGLSEKDLVVNCIGWIPQKASGNSIADSLAAIRANALLPNLLEDVSRTTGSSVMQILTDCVFSGDEGNYNEQDEQDASDLYGLTKRIGEYSLERTMGIRCSIVGFAKPRGVSLFDWLLGQPKGSTVNGYENHIWNGVSTSAFASLALGVFTSGQFLPGKYHWLPQDKMSKFQLLSNFIELSNRNDLQLVPYQHEVLIDRTLSSLYPVISQKLWQLAGYSQGPTIFDLVKQLVSEEAAWKAKELHGSKN
jgi:dTDP-4-dehydrorhamnose reductase